MITTEFNKRVDCCGEFVSVRIIDNCENMKVGNIYLPSSYENNSRLAFGQIESVGPDAKKYYGINVGDYVMFDRLSSFGHTAPVCMIRYNNVICLTDKDRSKFAPLQGMCFVEVPKVESTTMLNGVYVTNYQEKLQTGKVIAVNFDDNTPVKVGDTIVVSKGADNITLGDTTIKIYKADMIVAVVKE